ncbi:zinc finger protein 429-like isoform X2 [Protopterus annectens]|uniref:zinc finger protein 429-like isoform X2 n=1 Tax=Protopterus annectens TaxID=7888 RepID=UPI001CFA5A09|nr:zinc finger protein 429-like isoform X2 [Protopterus annectens]
MERDEELTVVVKEDCEQKDKQLEDIPSRCVIPTEQLSLIESRVELPVVIKEEDDDDDDDDDDEQEQHSETSFTIPKSDYRKDVKSRCVIYKGNFEDERSSTATKCNEPLKDRLIFPKHATREYKVIKKERKMQTTNVTRSLFQSDTKQKNTILQENLSMHKPIKTEPMPFEIMGFRNSAPYKVDYNIQWMGNTGYKPFHCKDCGKRFTYKSTLNRHQWIHSKAFSQQKPFKCSYCGKAFAQKSHLSRHQLVHTGNMPFRCSVCGKGFRAKGELANHMWVHTEEKPFKCTECEKCFTYKSNLTRHRIGHYAEKHFPCIKCRKSFTCKADLVKHDCIQSNKPLKVPSEYDNFEEGAMYETDLPKWIFTDEVLMQGDKDKYNECGEGFTYRSNHDVQKWVCDENNMLFQEKIVERSNNGTTFTHGLNVTTHEWNQTDEKLTEEKPIKCVDSTAHFTHSSHFSTHDWISPSQTLTQETWVENTDNSQNVVYRTDLPVDWINGVGSLTQEIPAEYNNHMSSFSLQPCIPKRRSGLKPFKCSLCEKCFRAKGELATHHRVHTGEKPFKCAYCEKCFTYKSNLTRHQMLHMGQKPFKCTLCGKCFTYKADLVRHDWIHSGKVVTEESHKKYMDHEKRVTEGDIFVKKVPLQAVDRPYKCLECGMGFMYKSGLVRHQPVHAGEVKIATLENLDEEWQSFLSSMSFGDIIPMKAYNT